MVRLREIPRTAAFAWSPGTSSPLLVTGTRSGAVDADFSDESKLELWDLNLDVAEQGLELQPIASISTDSRYYSFLCTVLFEPRKLTVGGWRIGSTMSHGAPRVTSTRAASLLAPWKMARCSCGTPRSSLPTRRL